MPATYYQLMEETDWSFSDPLHLLRGAVPCNGCI
jgi:hypothetical protein